MTELTQLRTGRNALLIAPRRIEMIETELPSPGSEQAIVETRFGSVSVGTETASASRRLSELLLPSRVLST